ncbi:MAG: GNAT family N-acetyltransferase [Anaerolineales bacterium]
MIEFKATAFNRIVPLFVGIEHNVPLVFGVLEGHSPGRVFVDRREYPTSALLVTDVGFMYVGGRSENEDFNRSLAPLLFDELLPRMTEPELILFAFSQGWRDQLETLLRPYGAIVVPRKLFAFDPAAFAGHAGWRERLPEGFRLQAIDAALAERVTAYAPLVDPRTGRFGVCMLHGEEIASACTAVSVGGGEVEIDIQTAEPYRGRELGILTACAFIEASLARGLTPSWACWPHRVASQALAKKLGFEPRPDVPAYYWSAGL